MSRKKLILTSLLCSIGTLSAHAPALAEITARDIRTEARTRWDYQPGQGPKRYARDRDYFSPAEASGVETIAPPPPITSPSDFHEPPRAEDRLPQEKPTHEPKTKTAINVGLQVSGYEYFEKELDMSLRGPHAGLTLDGTYAWGNDWFTAANTRLAHGWMKYKGTGTLEDVDNFIFETRALVGRDLTRGRYGISPYVGFGYRYLNNDLTGISSTGNHGYTRVSHYLFAPIGFETRMTLLNGARLALTSEFDPVVFGWQQSLLSDISAAYPDLLNEQKSGYGAKASLMYEASQWAAGPYINYWNLGRSTTECDTGTGAGALYICGYEPHNHTIEAGIQFRYRLY